jgi:hypothetical protein
MKHPAKSGALVRVDSNMIPLANTGRDAQFSRRHGAPSSLEKSAGEGKAGEARTGSPSKKRRNSVSSRKCEHLFDKCRAIRGFRLDLRRIFSLPSPPASIFPTLRDQNWPPPAHCSAAPCQRTAETETQKRPPQWVVAEWLGALSSFSTSLHSRAGPSRILRNHTSSL